MLLAAGLGGHCRSLSTVIYSILFYSIIDCCIFISGML